MLTIEDDSIFPLILFMYFQFSLVESENVNKCADGQRTKSVLISYMQL